MKHNKKRNTAFIYEALIREFTKAVIEQRTTRKEKIVSLLKEFFSTSCILGAELELYKVLMETINIKQPLAERLLQETKVAYAQLDEGAIFGAQSQLISSMNKKLGQEVWKNFIPNFKSLASINSIFNSKVGVKKRVLFEQAVVDKMSSPVPLSEALQLKSVDNLTYTAFIQKFNKKYGNLLIEQKELLNHYIASFADEGFELRLYFNEELSRLKSALKEAAQTQLEPLIAHKVGEVVEYLEGFRKREFTEVDLNKVLKTQELVQELSANDQN
jgi:hypothetical protein